MIFLRQIITIYIQQEAEKSLKFYRNIKEDAEPEAEAMLRSEVDKLKVMYLMEEKGEKSEETTGLTWSDFSKIV